MDPEKQESAAEKPGNLPEDVTKVLEEIKSKLEAPQGAKEEETPPAAPVYPDQREALKKKLGFNEDQMQAHEASIAAAQAPIIESQGWSRLERRADLETYRKEIEKELKFYPPQNRTPEIMEKIYFMVKGQRAESKPVSAATAPSSRVESQRVSRGPGYTGAEPGLSGPASEKDADEESLSDQEKFVSQKLGVSEKEYVQSRNAGKEIRKLRVEDQRPISGIADVELRRLQTRR